MKANGHEKAVSPAMPVDLRSDTVTQPTAVMYERMRTAPVGDDGLDGDPTVRELETVTAAIMGKQASLYVPSCTMANLLAAMTQARRGEQVAMDTQAHMFVSERGGATLAGLSYAGLPGAVGAIDLDALDDAFQASGYKLKTPLVVLETSHNNAGGAVAPLSYMKAVHDMARTHGSAVHLDGARLFNAAVALNLPPATVARHADTVSLCLCKGLSAPVGAMLLGDQPVIDRARDLRHVLGGSQRQAGVVAAAGLVAVQEMSARLWEDHGRAMHLSIGVNRIGPTLQATVPQTNIVQVDISQTGRGSAQWVEALHGAGLAVRPLGNNRLRCVTHRHISDADITTAISAFRRVAADMHWSDARNPSPL